MRLSIQVPPPAPLGPVNSLFPDHAAQSKTRTFLHIVKEPQTLTVGDLFTRIEQDYKNNYLDSSEYNNFVILKLQDEWGNDLLTSLPVSDALEDKSPPAIVKVIQARLDRSSSIPVTSGLRPVGYSPLKRRLPSHDAFNKRQRLDDEQLVYQHPDRPVFSTEDDVAPELGVDPIIEDSDVDEQPIRNANGLVTEVKRETSELTLIPRSAPDRSNKTPSTVTRPSAPNGFLKPAVPPRDQHPNKKSPHQRKDPDISSALQQPLGPNKSRKTPLRDARRISNPEARRRSKSPPPPTRRDVFEVPETDNEASQHISPILGSRTRQPSSQSHVDFLRTVSEDAPTTTPRASSRTPVHLDPRIVTSARAFASVRDRRRSRGEDTDLEKPPQARSSAAKSPAVVPVAVHNGSTQRPPSKLQKNGDTEAVVVVPASSGIVRDPDADDPDADENVRQALEKARRLSAAPDQSAHAQRVREIEQEQQDSPARRQRERVSREYFQSKLSAADGPAKDHQTASKQSGVTPSDSRREHSAQHAVENDFAPRTTKSASGSSVRSILELSNSLSRSPSMTEAERSARLPETSTRKSTGVEVRVLTKDNDLAPRRASTDTSASSAAQTTSKTAARISMMRDDAEKARPSASKPAKGSAQKKDSLEQNSRFIRDVDHSPSEDSPAAGPSKINGRTKPPKDPSGNTQGKLNRIPKSVTKQSRLAFTRHKGKGKENAKRPESLFSAVPDRMRQNEAITISSGSEDEGDANGIPQATPTPAPRLDPPKQPGRRTILRSRFVGNDESTGADEESEVNFASGVPSIQDSQSRPATIEDPDEPAQASENIEKRASIESERRSPAKFVNSDDSAAEEQSEQDSHSGSDSDDGSDSSNSSESPVPEPPCKEQPQKSLSPQEHRQRPSSAQKPTAERSQLTTSSSAFETQLARTTPQPAAVPQTTPKIPPRTSSKGWTAKSPVAARPYTSSSSSSSSEDELSEHSSDASDASLQRNIAKAHADFASAPSSRKGLGERINQMVSCTWLPFTSSVMTSSQPAPPHAEKAWWDVPPDPPTSEEYTEDSDGVSVSGADL